MKKVKGKMDGMPDVDVDYRDGGMTITSDGLLIDMSKNDDGSEKMKIIMEDATKLAAASAFAMGTAALF